MHICQLVALPVLLAKNYLVLRLFGALAITPLVFSDGTRGIGYVGGYSGDPSVVRKGGGWGIGQAGKIIHGEEMQIFRP